MKKTENHRRLLRRAIVVVAGSILAGLATFELKPPTPASPGEPPMREFGAFYAVGYVLNHYPAHRLYDTEFYRQVHRSLFPNAPPNLNAPYAHAPFEAVLFKPFAAMPYMWALRLWQTVCLALYSAGFLLLWRSSTFLSRDNSGAGLLVFLSFNCVCMESIVRGQASAVPFTLVCLAMYCVRRDAKVWAGAMLAGCLCKPTLLLLILPMLVIARQTRVLLGFALGAGVLAAVSLAIVGWEGIVAYVNVVLTIGRAATNTNAFASRFYVDFNNFFRMLASGPSTVTTTLFLATAVPLLALLVRTWLRVGPESSAVELLWPLTLTWTMLVNVYATTYDTPLAVAGLILTADQVRRYSSHSQAPFWTVVTVLYVASWVPAFSLTGSARLQVFTLGLAAVGVYQLHLASRVLTHLPGDITVDGQVGT
jgi:hypothetical protein